MLYKVFSAAFAAYIAILCAVAPKASAICGDADCDGVVTAADAELVFDWVAGKNVAISDTGKAEADVDGDGVLTVGDAAQILRYVNGSEKSLPSNALLRIGILSLPYKTVYAVGEAFDGAGLSLAAFYSDGSTRLLKSYALAGFSSTAGMKIVKATARGKTASFTVAVRADEPVGLEITTYPTQRAYRVGTRLNTAGLIVQAVYADGSRGTVTGYSFSGYDGEAGIHNVKLVYMGVSTQFTVGCGYNATVNGGGTKLNVRTKSDISSSVVGTFNEGDTITVIDTVGENGWCFCYGKSSGGEYISGWCWKQYLQIS